MYNNRMRAAKVATGFLLSMNLENSLECSLIKIMSMTKENIMYTGKPNCSNDFQNASIPSKKQVSRPASRLRDISSEAIFDNRMLLLFLISKILT